jgi:response regulator RpfG family c-di-GMP phosphodiesterase
MINVDFNSVSEILETFKDEDSCIKHLETLRWNPHVKSPFDPASKVYKCRGYLYKCKNSGKYFNAKTGTLFHNSKVELRKWYAAIWLVTEANKTITSVEMAKELDLTQKTAWYMIKRIKDYYTLATPKRAQKEKKTILEVAEEQKFVEEKLDMIQWLQQLQQNK